MNTISVYPSRKKASKAHAIFDAAFDRLRMRTPRSLEYMQGAYAALENAATAGDTDFTRNVCPYPAGYSAFDAWHSGADEGRRLWSVNRDMS